jgi:hypothetical protein
MALGKCFLGQRLAKAAADTGDEKGLHGSVLQQAIGEAMLGRITLADDAESDRSIACSYQ